MLAIDSALELGNDITNSYVGFLVPFLPSYKDRDTLMPAWLEEKLPTFIAKIEDMYVGPCLVSKHITLADLVLFSHFWKLAYNPKAD